jgi:hypothetical protein
MASPTGDAFSSTAYHPLTGSSTGLTTILDDGSAIATDSSVDPEFLRKYGVAVLSANCDGYDFDIAPAGLSLSEVWERHAERVRVVSQKRDAKPVLHESLALYHELHRALSLLRAEHRHFQFRFAGIVLRVGATLAGLAAALLIAVAALRGSTIVFALVLVIALALLSLLARLAPRLHELAQHRLAPIVFRRRQPAQKLRLLVLPEQGPYRRLRARES